MACGRECLRVGDAPPPSAIAALTLAADADTVRAAGRRRIRGAARWPVRSLVRSAAVLPPDMMATGRAAWLVPAVSISSEVKVVGFDEVVGGYLEAKWRVYVRGDGGFGLSRSHWTEAERGPY